MVVSQGGQPGGREGATGNPPCNRLVEALVRGRKGGRQIKQDSSRRFRDPWVTRIGVASINQSHSTTANIKIIKQGGRNTDTAMTGEGRLKKHTSTSWSANDDRKYGALEWIILNCPGWKCTRLWR